ncbi:MAG: tRNA (adenosine(37)-N6)-threonylcarbamoyltransferase complex dimerization subunit type 1 TsaB [Gemmatimonadota bacterium]|jgi:tRNA threonylcarbamoyladenosine biosynthesis protein TsaB
MTDSPAPRPFLAFDTATAVGGVAVGIGRSVLAEIVLEAQTRHAETLLPAIEAALDRAGCRGADLAGIVVGSGPGSFTGVRIAAAAAKGLVHAWRVPLYAWSSLAMTAAGAAGPDTRVVALYDARRGDVFAASYRVTADRLITLEPPFAAPLEAVLDRVDPAGAVFAGDGARLHEARIRGRGGHVADGAGARPAALLWLAATQPAESRIADPAAWEPEYVRASGAQRIHAP